MPGDVSVGFFPVSRRIHRIHNFYVFGYHGIDLFVQKCGIHWYTIYTETKMLSTSGEKRPRNRGSKCFELPFRPICECYLHDCLLVSRFYRFYSILFHPDLGLFEDE